MRANDIDFDKHKGEVFIVDEPTNTDRANAGWMHGDRITVVKGTSGYQLLNLDTGTSGYQLLNLDTMETSLYGCLNSMSKVVPLARTQPPSDGFWSDRAKLYNALTLDQRLEFERAFNSTPGSVYVCNSNPPSKVLVHSFKWADTPQGVNYWSDIHDKLEKAGL